MIVQAIHFENDENCSCFIAQDVQKETLRLGGLAMQCRQVAMTSIRRALLLLLLRSNCAAAQWIPQARR